MSFVKYAVILLSVCFAAFAFTFYGDELTIENFRYMLKFVSFDSVTVGSDDNRNFRYRVDKLFQFLTVDFRNTQILTAGSINNRAFL